MQQPRDRVETRVHRWCALLTVGSYEQRRVASPPPRSGGRAASFVDSFKTEPIAVASGAATPSSSSPSSSTWAGQQRPSTPSPRRPPAPPSSSTLAPRDETITTTMIKLEITSPGPREIRGGPLSRRPADLSTTGPRRVALHDPSRRGSRDGLRLRLALRRVRV
jgi:hypothetical protein